MKEVANTKKPCRSDADKKTKKFSDGDREPRNFSEVKYTHKWK